MTGHCFSVDVEGFCEGMQESIPIPSYMFDAQKRKNEISKNMDTILQWLDTYQIKGTFFVLGSIAEKQPEVIHSIAKGGHEIGSHSHNHLRLYNLSRKESTEAIIRSKKVLEDVSGKAIFGFRAPGFSITAKSMDMLDVIQKAGYRYDSSIRPTSEDDFNGGLNAKREIHHLKNGLIEFPPVTQKFLGKTIPALGGGYFRLYPLAVTKWILKKYSAKKTPAMFYMHPYELGPEYPRIDNISFYRRFRHYINMDKSKGRFSKLFENWRFMPAIDILREMNFISDN